MIGFDPQAAVAGVVSPAAPSDLAMQQLGLAVALGISALFALAVWFLSRYPLTRERFAELRETA